MSVSYYPLPTKPKPCSVCGRDLYAVDWATQNGNVYYLYQECDHTKPTEGT